MDEVKNRGFVRHLSAAASGLIQGKNIELRTTEDGEVQWRVEGAGEWKTLFALSDISPELLQTTGDRADAAMSQKAVTEAINRMGGGIELRAANGYIQWRAVGTEEWINMIPLSELSIELLQATGDRTDAAMSQRAVTEAINAISGEGSGWLPDYHTYVFKRSAEKPTAPIITTTDDLDNEAGGYWKDYPDTPDLDWWQCVGVVDGTKKRGEAGFIKSWSGVFPLNGKDGVSTEFRWKDISIGVAPGFTEEQRKQRDPEGWIKNPGALADGYSRWQTHAVIKPDNTENGALGGLWAIPYKVSGEDGKEGTSGASLKIKYQRTSSATVPPAVVADNLNPGSLWESLSNVGDGKYLWVITATILPAGGLSGVWQGPELMTGTQGAAPDYKTYVYKKTDNKPTAPTITTTDDLDNEAGGYWKDYPDTPGNWWQCIGKIDGTKGKGEAGFIKSWSDTYPFNGRDGVAQDGKYTELRWLDVVKGGTPVLSNTERQSRTPEGWSKVPSELSPENYRWQIEAVILPNDTIEGEYWSNPYRISGEDGTDGTNGQDGRDGKDIEFIFTRTATLEAKPEKPNSINSDDYIPGGWTDDPVGVTQSLPYEWVSKRTRVDSAWGAFSHPALWSKYGFDGNDGVGIDGLPGITLEARYCVGSAQTPVAASPEGKKDRQPTGWTTTLPSAQVTDENPYIWFTQARIMYADNQESMDNPYTGGTVSGLGWEKPARLSGINGLPGSPGAKGPVVFPAGIYSPDKEYVRTNDKAPYVYDGGRFYVLNYAAGEVWVGNRQQYKTPHEVVAAGLSWWIEFDGYDAIFAKIGIIANGLIGSAVFNGDYMFSQQGYDKNDGASGDKESTNYEFFCLQSNDVYDYNNPYSGRFIPNIMFNFRTGGGHMAAGKVRFYANGDAEMRDIKVQNVKVSGFIQEDFVVIADYQPYLVIDIATPNVLISDLDGVQKGSLTITDPNLVIGKPYKIRITNIARWDLQLDLHPSGQKFFAYSGGLDIDDVVEASGISLHYGASAEIIFIPSSFITDEDFPYWVGKAHLINAAANFVYVPKDKSYGGLGYSRDTFASKIIDQL